MKGTPGPGMTVSPEAARTAGEVETMTAAKEKNLKPEVIP
jgi:hypothetical protein